MGKHLSAGKYYSYAGGSRLDALHEHCKATNSPCVKPKVPVNGTRIASQHNLVIENLRLARAYDQHAQQLGLSDKKSEREDALGLKLTPEEWVTSEEFEAVLDIPRKHIQVVQFEKKYTAAYDLYLTRGMLEALSEEQPL